MAKKIIKVNPNMIKANKSASESSVQNVINVAVEGVSERLKCLEVDIDGPSKLVYVKSNGVWIETESRIVCYFKDGEERVFD